MHFLLKNLFKLLRHCHNLLHKEKHGKNDKKILSKVGKTAEVIFLKNLSSSSRFPLEFVICAKIFSESLAIRCMTCRKHFCSDCDIKVHSVDPFHRRLFVQKSSIDDLSSSEFFDSKWNRCHIGMFSHTSFH